MYWSPKVISTGNLGEARGRDDYVCVHSIRKVVRHVFGGRPLLAALVDTGWHLLGDCHNTLDIYSSGVTYRCYSFPRELHSVVTRLKE